MIVIADDITGAAEIAGIAFERGADVRLVCGCTNDTKITDEGITVIATDTRSMTEEEAIAETRCIAKAIPYHYSTASWTKNGTQAPSVIFKKTDSALRGHVVAELSTLMNIIGYSRAVYAPANPSKGRTIRSGLYYIDKTPINKTEFSFDPEFPATTASLRKLFPDVASKKIVIPDARTLLDLHCIIQLYDNGNTLFAGSGDLFGEFLSFTKEYKEPDPSRMADPSTAACNYSENTLILCGSTQSKELNIGIPISPMPQDIYDGADDPVLWDTQAYAEKHSLILTIPHTHSTGKEVAIHLRSMMAQVAKRLIDKHRPDQLIIEGGATAWATLQILGWTEFKIERQIAPGVVQMRADNGTLVTLKPGSYPWGGMFQSFSE